MHFRKNRIRCERLTETGDMSGRIESPANRIDPQPIIDRIALATAVQRLPAGYRAVFLLHDVEGYDHMQVGKILGISDGTSKSQLHKSRMRLREILKERASQTAQLN
jgi:RNA polymerase sigma-70 factor (ECF subfamily)